MDQTPQAEGSVLEEEALEHALTTSAFLMCMAFIEKITRGNRPQDPTKRTLKIWLPEGKTSLGCKIAENSQEALLLVKDSDAADDLGGKKNRVHAADSKELKNRKCLVAIVDDASQIAETRMAKIMKVLESCQPVYILIG